MSQRNRIVTSNGMGLKLGGAILMSILSWCPSGQAALLPGEGAETSAGLFTLYSNGGVGGPGTSDFNGGEGFSDSAVSLTHLLGTASAASTPSAGPVVAPAALKAKVILSGDHDLFGPFGSIQGGTGSAQAFSSERFRYIGTTPATLSLTVDFTFSTEFESPGFSDFVIAQVAVFSVIDYGFSPSIDTIVFEFGGSLLTSESGANEAVGEVFVSSSSGGPASEPFSVFFDVEPGQEFYVFQRLLVSAELGMDFADASNTLTSQFSDPDSIVRSSVIPEPASLLLLGGGLFALATRRRRA